ncbi:MAG TPA: hypothetical protein PK513_06310 [Alphaproteobacteria bacterium]|nr:hypothetical protein [Alphaproteobacteria bacterium]USO05180.1 MAG: hypothetical protein H6859_08495 [Rhodospirillales bacterium]HOO82096.1 hypothetical protein [Alphaproteobacteria bacterium]
MSFTSADPLVSENDHENYTHHTPVRFFDLQNGKCDMSNHDPYNDGLEIHEDFEQLDFEAAPFVDYDETPSLNSEAKLLSWAKDILSVSPSARIMLAEAKKQRWIFSIEALEGPDFHIDVPQKRIVLSDQGLAISALGRSTYFKNSFLVSLIRALRDVWQEKRHGGFDAQYACENVLMLERVRAADLDILAVLVGWELRGEGHGGLWRHLIDSEDGDLAMRFSGYLERDPASLFNGRALAAAFSQWFRADRRIEACDHETLNYLDTLMQENAFEEVFGARKLTPISIESLSCLPDRTAYLQGHGREIIADPLYAGLNDPINQAHYMQILYDLKVTRVQDVPFRDAALAEKIFPGGEFTAEKDNIS